MNLYYRDASAALLVFDRTNPGSFQNLKEWVAELESKVDLKSMVELEWLQVIAIVANKSDIPDKVITQDQIDELLSKYKFIYFETSAKTGEGVVEVFRKIAEACNDKFGQPTTPETRYGRK